MDNRLASLLQALVEEYVSSAEPVGSQHLVRRYRLDISPATVRNWFVELEDEGFLIQPHTSGGRVPTEEAFRHYVTTLLEPKPVTRRERDQITRAVAEDTGNLKHIAKALADLSGQVTVVRESQTDAFFTGLSQLFSQPEFRDVGRVIALSDMFDHLDEAMRAFRRPFHAPRVLIGRESPFGPDTGAVIASNGDAFLGIVGPLRMDYGHALSLIHATLEELHT
jgi:transcriptional regulator of heat shock response